MATRPNLQGLDPKATSSGILNWIMDNGQSSYFAGAPRADETDVSIRALGDYILGYQPRRNDFVHALVNLIGWQLIIASHYTNQWSWALRGTMTAGETIEEVFINPARAENFNLHMTIGEFLKDRFGNRPAQVLAAYHTVNFQKKYACEITQAMLTRAFHNSQGVMNLIDNIINSMYVGFELDNFIMLKYVLHRTALDGKMKVVKVNGVDTKEHIEDTLTVIKKVSNDLTFMADGSTISKEAVTRTLIPDQMDIIDTEVDANVSVRALAYAFNKEELEFLGKRTLVNEWTPYELSRLSDLLTPNDAQQKVIPFTEEELATIKTIKCFVVDKDFLMQVDAVVEVLPAQGQENTLTYKYFLHHHAYFGASIFKNAVVFTTSTPIINSVTITPATATLSKGASMNMSANISTSGIVSADVTWEVNDADKATIDQYGLLTIKPNAAAGQITVKATSVADPSKSGTATITITA